ncbi:MAG: hypothetical protein ABH823_00325 [bacterium]
MTTKLSLRGFIPASWTTLYRDHIKGASPTGMAHSLKEQARQMEPLQQTVLLDLLKEHELTLPDTTLTDIEELEPEHFRTVTRRKGGRVTRFERAFNTHELLDDFSIEARDDGQFQIRLVDKPDAAARLAGTIPVSITPSYTAVIMRIVADSNRPLTFNNIFEAVDAEMRKNYGQQADRAVVRQKFDALLEPKGDLEPILIETYTGSQARRFIFNDPIEIQEMLETTRSLYLYENDQGETQYIAPVDASILCKKRNKEATPRAYQVMRADSHIVVMSSARFFSPLQRSEGHSQEVLGVSHLRETKLYVLHRDAQALVEKGELVAGRRENPNFDPCYITQNKAHLYCFELFNEMAIAFLSRDLYGDFAGNYAKLRAAFEIGFTEARNDNGQITARDFLYEARTVIKMGGNQNALLLALLKKSKCLAAVKAAGIFQAAEIAALEEGIGRTNLVLATPFQFRFNWSYALQNLIHFTYANMGSLDVMQNVIVRKMASLRDDIINQRQRTAEENLQLQGEIEMLLAPMAESKGFIDEADHLRDLVARLTYPDRYAAEVEQQETAIGMSRQEAKRHLPQVAKQLADFVKGAGHVPTSHTTRVKEIASNMNKTEDLGDVRADNLGIRLIGRNLDSAKGMAKAILNNPEYKLAPPELCPKDKNGQPKAAVADHLEIPNNNGWRGWRGYFLDPTVKEGEPPRVISIQILTEGMQKADKMGLAGHWIYKAERSAARYCADLKVLAKERIKWRKQFFDPARAYEYNGDARHDFQVDLDRARASNQVFFIDDGEPFTSLTNLAGRSITPLLRVNPGETVEDAMAFRANGDDLISGYSHMEVYKVTVDANDQLVYQPYNQGGARVSLGTEIPDYYGAGFIVLVPKFEGQLDTAALAELRKKVKRPRTKLLIARGLNPSLPVAWEPIDNPVRPELLAQVVEPEMQTMLARLTDLTEGEVVPAVSLGFVSPETIEHARRLLTPDVKIQKGPAQAKIVIDTPYKNSLFNYILTQLEGYDIVATSGRVEEQTRGISTAHIEITVALETEEKKNRLLTTSHLTDLIKDYNTRFESGRIDEAFASHIKLTLKIPPWEVLKQMLLSVLAPQIGIFFPRFSPWNAARQITSIIRDYMEVVDGMQIDVADFSLPASSGISLLGEFNITATGDVELSEFDTDLLSEAIAQALPNLEFGLELMR